MRQLLRTAALTVLGSLICSCAAVSLTDTWRNPTLPSPGLKRVLVVSILKNDASRRIYEDMLGNELAGHGVEPVLGYTLMPEDGGKWSELDKAMKKASAQAVLTVQTIKVQQQTTVQPGYVTTYPGMWYPEAFPSWDLYGYYGSLANYGPAYISTYDVATMQVNLFDAASGKLIWAATLKSDEPEKVTAVGQELAKKVVEALVKAGII